jgi:hypothetical protein
MSDERKVDVLKPCPFCGSAAEWTDYGKGGSWHPLIVCANPFCQARIVGSGATRDLMRQNAKSLWNARATGSESSRKRLMQASGFGALLSSVLGSGALRENLDLLDRVTRAVADNEEYVESFLGSAK